LQLIIRDPQVALGVGDAFVVELVHDKRPAAMDACYLAA